MPRRLLVHDSLPAQAGEALLSLPVIAATAVLLALAAALFTVLLVVRDLLPLLVSRRAQVVRHSDVPVSPSHL